MPKACKFIEKETLEKMFSCEFPDIFKNTFFKKTPPVAASVNSTLWIEPNGPVPIFWKLKRTYFLQLGFYYTENVNK